MFSFFRKKSKNSEPKCSISSTKREECFDDVSIIADYFRGETGVTFDKQLSILRNKVIAFARLREIYSFEELLHSIGYNTTLKQELIDHLTTNETFFYREFAQIQKVVSLVKKGGKNVRILCAPSATGEEPYSIAIALLEAGVARSSFSIMGIDINQEATNRAKEAIYAERNVRNLSKEVLSRYFTQEAGGYALSEEIKSLVSFKVVNIFDAEFKHIGKFDYIFSRNMLIYFDHATKLKAKKILQDLRNDPDIEIFFGHADLF